MLSPARLIACVVTLAAVVAALSLTATSCGQPPAPPPPPPPKYALIPPLADAQAGEVLMLSRGGAQKIQYTIVSTSDTQVEVEIIPFQLHPETGELLPDAPRKEVWSRNLWGMPLHPGSKEDGLLQSIEQEVVRVNGKDYRCWRLELSSAAPRRWYWICADVPVNGLVRVAVDSDEDGAPELENAYLISEED